MGEIIMVSSLRDNGGVSFYDLATGSIFSHSLKSCTCDTGGLAVIGGPSSFSGKSGGGSGDYIVASQSKKPSINIWQWGKPQGGRIFCWEISSGKLVVSWQGHYKTVTSMVMTACGTFLLSGADDGMVRSWDVPSLLTTLKGSGSKKNIPPFRSWTPHSLPIANVILQQAGTLSPCNLRVITVSADRTLAIQEVFSNRQVAKIAFPEALTSCASNYTLDVVYVGAASGRIYILDLSVTAVALSAAHSKVIHADTGASSSLLSSSLPSNSSSSSSRNTHTLQEGNYSILIGHDKAVTSLTLARDNFTLVSVSMDGTTKIWNTISRQCLKELNPFNKSPLSNVMLLLRPEVIDGNGIGNIHKPTLCPISHLRKYPDGNNDKTAPSSNSVTNLDGNSSLKGMNRRFFGGQSHLYSMSERISRGTCGGGGLVANPDVLLPLDMSAHTKVGPCSVSGKDTSQESDYVSLRGEGGGLASFVGLPMENPLECAPVPALLRQDTFGDEFYDNWKKNVKVNSIDSKRSMPTLLETESNGESEDTSLSLELQLQAWKRLASELQGQLDESEKSDDTEIVEEAENIEPPKKQQQTKKSPGPQLVVLSETDRFKVPKSKGSGGGRKRYHEAYLEERESKTARADGVGISSATDEGPGSRKKVKNTNSSKDSDRRNSKKEVVVRSTAAPPQSKKRKNNK